MNIILFGFKSCGKGWVGKSLAKTLKEEFIDTDDLIEGIYFKRTAKKLSYREIAKKHGMGFFRELEKEAVKIASSKDNKIIASGGGTPLFSENVAEFKKNGRMVLLKVEKETLFKRIMDSGIPAFFDPNNPRGSFEKLLKERMEKFEKIADFSVNYDNKTAEEISKEIIKLVGKG